MRGLGYAKNPLGGRRRSLLWTSTIFLSSGDGPSFRGRIGYVIFYNAGFISRIPPKSWRVERRNVISRRLAGTDIAIYLLHSANYPS